MSLGVGRLRRALDHQYAAAVTVGSGALIALLWSALGPTSYRRVLAHPWFPGHDVGLHGVILNGLMTVFFAAVGLELSREIRSDLRHQLRASLPPLLGAVGGMAGTAIMSLAIGHLWDSPALRRGWGIPMATDIAFTLGVLALAGDRVPTSLRLFLLTLAIGDDVLSVVILSATGASHVRTAGLVAIVVVTAAGYVLGRRVPAVPAFALVLVAMWLAFAWAGVEPALSGVVAGIVVPVTTAGARRVETTMARCATGAALPLFALVACGVTWSSLSTTGATGKIIGATVVIRIVGKMAGIGAGVALARTLGARRDPGISVGILAGGTMLCAIGFTVPLLFAGALFPATSATYGAFTLGLFTASVLSAVLGVVILRRATAVRT